MNVVFDTHIFISALALPGGHAEHALTRITDGRDRLIISKAIIQEVLGVLAKKFSHDREELARVAVFLFDLGSVVEPRKRIHLLEDEPDNRILECAVAGRADRIVTGDRRMLELGTYRGTEIIPLKKYLSA